MSIENLEKSEIEEMSDLKFARYILQKVLETVQYPTSPLLVETSKVIPSEMPDDELERIAALIARGYGSGMIQERSYEDE